MSAYALRVKPYILRAEIAQMNVAREVAQYGQWDGAYCLDAVQFLSGGGVYRGHKHTYQVLINREGLS